ncbi:MAG: DUF397 domain-containing protein [Actinomycetota bacterium]
MTNHPHCLTWVKSSFSGANGNCVEIAVDGHEILLRNSKRPDEQPISFATAEIEAFVAACKAGEFDGLVD